MELRDYQNDIINKVFEKDDNVLIVLPTGGGKEQPLSSKILTKNGYILMGDVKVGDKILDGLGKECTVTGVFPQGLKQVYKITFSDDTFIRVGKEHINRFIRHAKTRYKGSSDGKTIKLDLTTSELIRQFETDRYNFWCQLPVCELNEDSELKMDPYLLGFLLGDGSLAHSHKKVSISEHDLLVKLQNKVDKYNCHLVYNEGVDYDITRNNFGEVNPIKQFIDENGLNAKSTEKHIPSEYLFSSVKQRTELLQGLFDSDGYVSLKKGKGDSEGCTFEWSTSSEQLSEDFSFLVRSLGCVDKVMLRQPHYTHNGEKREGKLSYRHWIKVPNTLQICTSEKHTSKIRQRQHEPMRKIVSICEDGFEECQCIMVDSPDHTYITDNVTVTHNTVIAKEIIRRTKEQILFIVPKLDLIKQAADTFDEKVDVIWSSNTIITGRHITVASKQTLLFRDITKYFRGPITVIVDEVHIGLQSLKKCLGKADVKRIIGLTATPERQDGKSFIVKENCSNVYEKEAIYEYAVFNRVINDWNIQELQKLGYLSPLRVILNPQAEKLSKVKPKHKYDDELDSNVIMGMMGDDFFAFVKKAKEFVGKPTLIFTPDLKSLDVVMDTLNKSGLKYKGIDGSMPVPERQVILAELKNGEIDGVVNCGVLTTGFDMPKVKQCILIRNIKSKPLLFQIVGRFIRPYEGETAEIYDFAGSSYNFATATTPNVFERPVDWQYEGFEVQDIDEVEVEKTEELKECLDEVNITWTEYLKDPVSTLLDSLLKYKEDFEKNIYDTSLALTRKLNENFDKTVNKKVNEQVQTVKDEIIKNSEQVIQEEIKKRGDEIAMNPIKNWFAINGFDWFKVNYPQILKKNDYDDAEEYKIMRMEYASTVNDEESMKAFENRHKIVLDKLDKIKLDTVIALPFEGLLKKLCDDEELEGMFVKLYDERTSWWLSHFKLNYTTRAV